MAVLSYREVIPRTFSHKFGESPTAERKYIVTLDEPTPTQAIISAIGIAHAAPHPEFAYLVMLDASVEEIDRQHAEVTYKYEAPKQEDLDPNPLARPDVWSFSVTGAEAPALFYYDNSTLKPLVNSAGDFFEGLTINEAEVRATIAWNRETFPLADAVDVTNCINSQTYLGAPPFSWKCAGISSQQASEVVNDETIRFWQGTTELLYRRDGWNLRLPNVGWHYITGNNGAKFQCFVRDPTTGTDVPASCPQPLDANGSLKYVGGTSGPPDILERRIYRAIDFQIYFGTPPF